MEAITHLEKVIVGEASAVTHLEKVIAGETSAVTYTEKVITGEVPPITHLQKVIAGKASPVTHLEYVWAGGSPTPTEHEYTGAVPVTFTADGTPLLDFLISGNMSQTGTPTPDSPIMPEGCGDLETSGEKAGLYKIPISSANTTTPVYLGEVQTTRKIYKYEFKGSETWGAGSENYYSFVPQIYGYGVPFSAIICSHCSDATINNAGQAVWFKKTAFPDITTGAELKQFCADQYTAGTPVTVWYVLATETTGIVNEPLMKIGEYADTLSMEQAGVSIPTNNGSTTVDVETTLKPSEVYIKYKGV